MVHGSFRHRALHGPPAQRGGGGERLFGGQGRDTLEGGGLHDLAGDGAGDVIVETGPTAFDLGGGDLPYVRASALSASPSHSSSALAWASCLSASMAVALAHLAGSRA